MTPAEYTRVLRTLESVARGQAVSAADMDAARVEVRRVMRKHGASTRLRAGRFNREAEAWWRLLGGLT